MTNKSDSLPDALPKAIAVVMVTWRSSETLRQSLGALERLRGAVSLEMALIDNASGDETFAEAKRLAPWANCVENEENVGFARACNQGAALTRAPLILFINPDAWIGLDDLTLLRKSLEENPRAAAAAPAIVDPKGRLWPSAHADPNWLNYWTIFSLLAPLWRRAQALACRVFGEGKKQRHADWLMGACLLVRRQAFEEIGGFSEAYHMYCEDAELGWNLRARGGQMLYLPAARAVHQHGKSSAQDPRATRVRLWTNLRLYGRRCRDKTWIESFGRCVRIDMRLRLALVWLARLANRGFDSDNARRGAFREILEVWRKA